MRITCLVWVTAVVTLLAAPSAAEPRWQLDGALALGRFEQQAKTEVGGARGERLVQESQLSYLNLLAYRIWGPISVGGYFQIDLGSRSAARFAGFDSEDRTLTEGQVGGAYTEYWAGPLIRLSTGHLLFELGHGSLGARYDDAREDLSSEDGNTEGALGLRPSIAWMVNAGGRLPITRCLHAVLRLEYRVRYYDRRAGKPLEDRLVHGTQNLTPFFGLAWSFGPEMSD
jgi:hypothetical protein